MNYLKLFKLYYSKKHWQIEQFFKLGMNIYHPTKKMHFYFHPAKSGKKPIQIGENLYLCSHVTSDFKLVPNIIILLMQKMYLKQQIQHFELLSEKDDVTDFWNQRRMIKDLNSLIEQVKCKKLEHFNILFIDLDKFKLVNDRYGHIVGSFLLVEVSKIIRQFFKSNYLYRYGGDEFVVILPGVDAIQGVKEAELLSNIIARHTFLLPDGTPYRLTVSVGLSQCPDNALQVNEIIHLADQMMYTSKKQGQGKVLHFAQARGRS
jgi:diguanylate cyclase (GGDEF)-like protein